MASLGTTISDDVKPDTGGGGGLCPEGDWMFEATEGDVVATTNGDGKLLKLTLQGLDPENKGMKVWVQHTIEHTKSSQAQTIGQGQIKALAEAIGMPVPDDSDHFLFKPFGARIIHKQQMGKGASGKYDVPQFFDNGKPKMRAEVARYLFGDVEEFVPSTKAPAQAAPAQQAAPASQAATPARSWQRKAG